MSQEITLPVSLVVGRQTYGIGSISGASPDELTERLADLADEMARLLRGPEATPAPPCESCGKAMVYRRGHTGRYLPLSRDASGDVRVYGVHYVASCELEQQAAATERSYR